MSPRISFSSVSENWIQLRKAKGLKRTSSYLLNASKEKREDMCSLSAQRMGLFQTHEHSNKNKSKGWPLQVTFTEVQRTREGHPPLKKLMLVKNSDVKVFNKISFSFDRWVHRLSLFSFAVQTLQSIVQRNIHTSKRIEELSLSVENSFAKWSEFSLIYLEAPNSFTCSFVSSSERFIWVISAT